MMPQEKGSVRSLGKALELLELAREDARQHRDNAGYLHLFAHLFVYTCEKSRGEMREQVRREYYDDVERAVEDAIRLDPAYAKFYCTKARVVAQRGRYAEAYSLINKAVATESSARKDYALRLLDYRHCETVILLQEQREYFQGEMEKLRRSVPSLPVFQGVFAVFLILLYPCVDLLIANLMLLCNLGVVASILDALFHKCDSFLVSCLSPFGHTAASCMAFQFLMTIIQLYPVL